MEAILNLESLFHRSRDRIKGLGEVYTPDEFVDNLLEQLSKDHTKIWKSLDNVLFEPCCGHGNIVVGVLKKRLNGLYKASLAVYSKQAALFAVANSINTLWAIDIDESNIQFTRTRVLFECVNFLKDKLAYKNTIELLEDHIDFFSHLLPAIKWHVFVNETLSSLTSSKLEMEAKKTKTTKVWLDNNEHQEMDFSLTWHQFYEDCEENNVVPVEYEASLKFLDKITQRKNTKKSSFDFANLVFLGVDSVIKPKSKRGQ